jgi:hypothetical protein
VGSALPIAFAPGNGRRSLPFSGCRVDEFRGMFVLLPMGETASHDNALSLLVG